MIVSSAAISRRLLVSGFIVVLLALGNILYAKHKTDQYESEIRETLEQMKAESHSKEVAEFERTRLFANLDIDRESQSMRRLVSRHDYYVFVRRGGNALLALAGVLLLGSVTAAAFEKRQAW